MNNRLTLKQRRDMAREADQNMTIPQSLEVLPCDMDITDEEIIDETRRETAKEIFNEIEKYAQRKMLNENNVYAPLNDESIRMDMIEISFVPTTYQELKSRFLKESDAKE